MNINIKRFTFFISILIFAVYGIQYGLDRLYNKRVSQKFTKIFKHETDPEIMIFGSSVVYHQFDPEIIKNGTGKTVYNMGWDGIFFVQYNALMKEFLSYEKTCKYIVIGCDFFNLGKNELITRPDLFLAYLSNNYVYESLIEIEPRKIFCAKYLPGYKLTILNKSFYNDILFALASGDKDGYSPSEIVWNKTGIDTPHNGYYIDHIFSELKSTVEAFNKKGVKVILVMTPVYEDGYKLILNAEQIKLKYRSLVSKDVYFLDYSTDSICKTKSYFYNYSHLNLVGATKFSNAFTTDLLHIIHE